MAMASLPSCFASGKNLFFVLIILARLTHAFVSYKGLYVVDRQRIGKPDCQQNLVRAWAEALHGPLASYAGKVLDINTPHLVYGPALDWSARHRGHEVGQVSKKGVKRSEGGVIATGRLQMQPVACLDMECNQATLVLLHNWNETLKATIGHQAWLVSHVGESDGAIYQSTMPANLASYDADFYAQNKGSWQIHPLGKLTQVRLLSAPTWRPCEGRGITIPIAWSSQTSEDTDTVCVSDPNGISAIVGQAMSAGVLSPSAGVNVTLASNPVLCNTSLYVDYGENKTNVFSRPPPGNDSRTFVSCRYDGAAYRTFLYGALGDLTLLERCNGVNAVKGDLTRNGCPKAENCSFVYRMKASLHNSIINQGGRLIREIQPNLSKPHVEPGREMGINVCYGSWPYIDPLPASVDSACQAPTNESCNELFEFVFYDSVLDFLANILYDQAVNLALAQKQLEIAPSFTLWGALAAIFIAATAAIGALPSARQFLVSVTWGWSHKRRLYLVTICMVAVGLVSASTVWQLLISITPYISKSYYYIPVSTEHIASPTPQPVYFIGFAIIEVRGERSVLGALITGALAITLLVFLYAWYACKNHHEKKKVVTNRSFMIKVDHFGAVESLSEADTLLLHSLWRQIRPAVDANAAQVQDISSMMESLWQDQGSLASRLRRLEEAATESHSMTR